MSDPAGWRPVRGGSYAWLQPDGGWGLSNAGLILGQGESVMVDTLFDLTHTQAMLEGAAELTAAAPISALVNTHGNGDHWFGNQLVPDVEIIASVGTLADMQAVGPGEVSALLAMPGRTGDYTRRIFGDFDFGGISPRYPNRTYERELTVRVGGLDLLLLDVGPAHTRGDTIVYCERDRVVYTGDIVFAGGTPILWAGPVANWVAACRRIRELGAELLVPGHGPICAPAVASTMVDYLEFVAEQAGSRFALGMPPMDAARDIDLGVFAGWPESERLALNVSTIYRELSADPGPPPPGPELFGCMAELKATTPTIT